MLWFFVRKIIVTDKNCCDVFICLQDQNDRNAIIKSCAPKTKIHAKKNTKHIKERYSRLHNHSTLLHFSQTRELQSSKAFFTAINQNYDRKKRTLKYRNTQNVLKSTNHS